jgi:glutamate synthase (NADPH/NADH) small chain
MKLDKALVARRVALLEAAGITFVTNTEVGADYPAQQLQEAFDAIVLCTGATRPRDLAVPGQELNGIHFAVDYLTGSTHRLLAGNGAQPPISAAGKDVIVIGGGDTGTDCVATALRQGCRSLVQFEILPRPPAERPPDNPWPQWPRVHRVDYGQAEAAAHFGRDPRRFCMMTTAFTGEQGQVTAAETVEVTWSAGENGHGRPRPVPLPGSERQWPTQLVLLALGFLGPEQSLPAQLGVGRTDWSTIEAPYGSFATDVPGVFAAGDARRGQSLVVWAIQEGRGVARACDQYLMGETDLP